MDKPKAKTRPWNTRAIQQAPMAQRVRVDFYHTSRWTKESRLFRQENPLCSKCVEEGIVYPSEVTDHKVPLEICEDPWDRRNWDAICKRHNNIKAAQDKILIKQYKKTHSNEPT
jgi:5-methylcytosine-specific restriction endonuclease McrA